MGVGGGRHCRLSRCRWDTLVPRNTLHMEILSTLATCLLDPCAPIKQFLTGSTLGSHRRNISTRIAGKVLEGGHIVDLRGGMRLLLEFQDCSVQVSNMSCAGATFLDLVLQERENEIFNKPLSKCRTRRTGWEC